MNEKIASTAPVTCSHGDDYRCYEDLKAERDRYAEAFEKIKAELYGCDRINCRSSARSIARIIADVTGYVEPDEQE